MSAFDVFAARSTVGVRDVRAASRLIARFHWLEAQLLRVAAGRLAELPGWETKCLVGRHLWQDSLHADAFLRRMVELRWPRTAPLHPGEALLRLVALLDEAPDEPAYLHAVYRVVKPRLAAGYVAYGETGPSVDDEPSQLLAGQVLAEERAHVAEGEALLTSLAGTYDMERALAFQARVDRAFADVRGLSHALDEVERELTGQFEGQAVRAAPPRAARDGRFRWADDAPFEPGDDPTDEVRLIAHRDADNEMHAAEVLGRNIYETPHLPWDFHRDMARQLYDEVRHAVLYQRYVEELGGALGDYPIVPGNYAYRMGLDLPHRIYDLHLRGERLGMSDVMRYRNEARRSGDRTYELLNDFVHADEVPHVKNGRWLKALLGDDEDAFRRIERETMEIREAYQRANPDDPIVRRYAGVAGERAEKETGAS